MNALSARYAALQASLELQACDGRELRPEEFSQALVECWHCEQYSALDVLESLNPLRVHRLQQLDALLIEALAANHEPAKWADIYHRIGVALCAWAENDMREALRNEIKAAQARLDDEREGDDYESEFALTNRLMDAERARAMNAEVEL